MIDQPLSFDEGQPDAGPATCSRCETTLSQYWGVDGAVLCERCKDEVIQERTDPAGGSVRFLKALGLGLGGMLVGAGVWYAVAKLAHLEIGIIAILLGFLVGRGIFYGSGKRGGLGYQLLAVAVTYLGIGVAMAPLALEEYTTSMRQSVDSARAAEALVPMAQLSDSAIDAQLAALDTSLVTDRKGPAKALPAGAAVAVGIVALFVLVLSLPVLSIVGGGSFIGIIIYGIALFEAFRLNRKVEPVVSGPHAVGAVAGG